MIKVLIADLDIENVKNFKLYIKISFPSIKTVNTLTSSNKDIVEVVKQLRPDLIIADIRFFGASVFKVMSDISEKYPDTKFILYGTYNDSEYLQKAEELGMINCMYRPIKPNDFHKTMDNALDFFKEYREQQAQEEKIRQSMMQNIELYKDKFLFSLVNGHISDIDEINRSFKFYKFDFKSDFTVFILRIDHFKKIVLTLDIMEKHMMIYRMLSIINTKIKVNGLNGKAFSNGFNSIITIISGIKDDNKMITICEHIKTDVLNKLNIRITIGIGRTYESVLDTHISYKEADAALRYRFYIGYNTVIPIFFVEPMNKITYNYPIEKEERLVYTAVIGEYDYCINLLNQIINALKKCEPLPDKLIPKIILDILMSISRYASEQNIIMDKYFTTFFSTSEALALKTLDEAYDYLSKALKNFCEYIIEFREENNKNILEAGKEYLKQKYYENISVSKIAVSLNTTPDYLNKLFKDSEKKTFFEYAVTVRLENAKRLMAETSFEDDVIAVKVGYDEVRHFKGVFKQYTDMTTTEYRIKLKGRV